MRNMLKNIGKIGGVAMALALATAANAAVITFDVRGPGGSKNVATPSAGGTVQLDLYAIVANGNSNQADDGFLLAHGSILTTDNQTQLGNLSAMTLNSPFIDTSVSNSGTPTNLDGNADLELGGTNPASSTGYIIASTGTSAKFGSGTSASNTEFYLGSVIWTYSGGDGSTAVQFAIRNRIDGAAPGRQLAKFTSDGVANSLTGVDAQIQYGAPVVIGIPEPTSAGLLALGLLGAAARRRRA